MDYQFVHFWQFAFGVVLCMFLNNFLIDAVAFYERDLILTPKASLQISGKTIYYEDNSNNVIALQQNHTENPPWERTLKHVAYITLFPGWNERFVKNTLDKSEYHQQQLQPPTYAEFLRSPYIRSTNVNYARFGDIVTLATGRLISANNGTFQFLEGLCAAPYAGCEAEHVWAFWQVQKIRHRDDKRHFRYELKFSITPLRSGFDNSNSNNNNGTNKRNAEISNHPRRQQSFIQKEDDYPHSFRKLITPQAERFFERKYEDQTHTHQRHMLGYAAPSVVIDQQSAQQQQQRKQQITPIPEMTFMHPIFQPHPGLPPSLPLRPEMLNMGELMRYKPPFMKTTSKIELYPSIPHLMNTRFTGQMPTPIRPTGISTTTYHPKNFQYSVPKPDIYAKPVADFSLSSTTHSPVVAHHFHHHYFMPNSAEVEFSKPNEVYTESQANPVLKKQTYKVSSQTFPSASQIIAFPIESVEQHQYQQEQQQFNRYINTHEQGNIVEVTPPPHPLQSPATASSATTAPTAAPYAAHPLQKPFNYHRLYPQEQQLPYTKEPFLIYAAPIDDATAYATPSIKPFKQSEQYNVTNHYSEPDPLYTIEPYTQPGYYVPKESEISEPSTETGKPDTILAQLPAPDREQDQAFPYEEEIGGVMDERNKSEPSSNENHGSDDQEEKPSQKNLSFKTKSLSLNHSTNTIKDGEKITDTINTTTQVATLTEAPSLNNLSTSTSDIQQFVSSSTTHRPPLRSLSRFRPPQHTRTSTTTTEKPVLKWKPKRRQSTKLALTAATKLNFTQDYSDSNNGILTKSSTTTAYTNVVLTTPPTIATRHNEQQHEEQKAKVVEILTQKSVSIKIGENGEEIPINSLEDEEHLRKRIGYYGTEKDNEILDNKQKLFKNNL